MAGRMSGAAPSDRSRLILSVLYAAWVFVFVYAFIAYDRAPHEGAGFPDGLNKIAVYLGWQGVAAMLALAVFGLGRGWPKRSGVRRLSAIPLGIAGLHAIVVTGVIFWAGGLGI